MPSINLNAWKLAIRIPTLPAAIAPVLVGWALAERGNEFALGPALAAFIGALLLQIGANFANDVFDFEKGTDTESRLGPPRATQLGLISPQSMKVGMSLTFVLALGVGIYLVSVAGWPIIVIGLASILAALIYTGGPWPIGYHGLGELFTFLFFGVVAVAGTYYVQTESFNNLTWLSTIPLGFTVTAILVVNNLRDIPTDSETNKRTLGVILGDRKTRIWYTILISGAYLSVALIVLLGLSDPWTLLTFASLPIALIPLRDILSGTKGPALNRTLKATALAHLIFGLLFSASLTGWFPY